MLVQLLVTSRDPSIRDRVERLPRGGVRVTLAEPGIAAAEAIGRYAPDVVLLDRDALDPDPAARIAEWHAGDRPIAVLCSVADADSDARADLLGAGCRALVDGAVAEDRFHAALLAELADWREAAIAIREADAVRPALRLGDFVTASAAMSKFIETARRVSTADTSVLILGETGVGKERLATAIHASGPRCDNPLVVVNCGAIPETLIESELFGHERGAFTGAERTHRGYFELAHRGTIFLDEIGELPPHLQVKLLRVLQEREIRRIGAEKAISVDVRVIAATNRDLAAEMEAGRFRSDLFYRLSVVTLTIPPLRDRTEDITLLVDRYLRQFADELGRDVRAVATEAAAALQRYPWPGNVREVINVMERAVLLSAGDTVTLEDLPDAIAACHPAVNAPLSGAEVDAMQELGSPFFDLPLRQAKQAWNAAFERLYLEHVLAETSGKVGAAAARIGIDPRSLYAKMRALGLRKEEYR